MSDQLAHVQWATQNYGGKKKAKFFIFRDSTYG